uniref:Beta-lactamase domain protein n=1 Tax=uncultured bacterium BAC AB649/1850 TaxID=1037453 RepID=F6K0V5_9BACT|nr:beta-lactamase domain protein [uncultured bacterium BAC AB649/1850]
MPTPPVRRRHFLTASAATALVATTGAAQVTAQPAGARPSVRRPATFRWLGTSGWRITIGSRTVLVDPYLTRFPTGLFTGAFDPRTPLRVDPAAIAAQAGRPESVWVTHTHWDHFNDVPHVATTTGARVFGTLTAYHLGLAAGVPAAQLSPVKGGEVLDFGDHTVEVVASLHSRNAGYSMAFPGVRTAVPAAPATIADLPEGDTLAFQITTDDGHSMFFMGASDFDARNLDGLAPDVAAIAVPSSDATHAYVPRLLEALRYPAVVVPVHWDNFEQPLLNPPPVVDGDARRLSAFVDSVRRVSPRTRVIVPDYLTDYTFR